MDGLPSRCWRVGFRFRRRQAVALSLATGAADRAPLPLVAPLPPTPTIAASREIQKWGCRSEKTLPPDFIPLSHKGLRPPFSFFPEQVALLQRAGAERQFSVPGSRFPVAGRRLQSPCSQPSWCSWCLGGERESRRSWRPWRLGGSMPLLLFRPSSRGKHHAVLRVLCG